MSQRRERVQAIGRRRERIFHAESRREHQSDETQPYIRNGIAIVRVLDEEQAIDIRTKIADLPVLKEIPGTQVRGYGDQHESSLTILSKMGTSKMNFLHMTAEDVVLSAFERNIPTMREAVGSKVLNVGAFGAGAQSPTISMSAAFTSDSKTFHENERGNAQIALCELNDWNPVSLPDSIPSISFLKIPKSTDVELVAQLRHQIREVLPPVLYLQPAEFIYDEREK